VWRRDFTVNALYYNIADFSLWDYVGGAEDIKTRTLRLIGDPETRFREDPVRMLRAARFEAKLGFQIEPATAKPIGALRQLLAGVIESAPPEHWHELATILEACDRATREAQARLAIPRRFALGVREMFALQPRLEHPRGRRSLRLLEQARFRAGYDLLLLRAE